MARVDFGNGITIQEFSDVELVIALGQIAMKVEKYKNNMSGREKEDAEIINNFEKSFEMLLRILTSCGC